MAFKTTHSTGNRLALLDTLPKGAVCAELGVFQGALSREIIARCHPKRFFMIDRFEGQIDSGDENGKNFHTLDMRDVHDDVANEFGFEIGVSIVQSDSVAWLATQSPGSLGWVYIDTDHSFRTTVRELAAAHYAVKDGGVIAGHDFSTKYFPGVPKAVEGFCEELGLDLEIWEGDALASYSIINKRH
jgi:hypothetical protein